MSIQRPSFTDFDRPYRRGVVLGLSLAELFIILVFLLLLTMLGYVASREQELEDYERELAKQAEMQARAKDERVVAQSAASGLRDQLARAQRAIMEAEWKRKEADERANRAEIQLGALIEDVDPNKLIFDQSEEIRRLASETDGLRDKLEKIAVAADIGKQLQQIAEQSGISPNDLLANSKKINDIETYLSELKAEAQILEETTAQKGQDSPCWYRTAKRPNGVDYERGLYIFDVRISDRHIFVKDIPAPTPEYQKQKEGLKFDRTALNRKLDYTKFAYAFRSLKTAGENKKVRDDRRCTFYVRVWDATSSKSAYKEAHNKKVQGVFSTYEVKTDPWPHK